VAYISGNVSFYNESSAGKEVDPSPVVACLGIMKDYSKAITMKFKKENSGLFMAGKRKNELGGSVYYEINKQTGANIPKIDFENEKNSIHAIVDAINSGYLLSCHDISDGGLGTAVSEMTLGGDADGTIGAEIDLDFSDLRADQDLFSETTGFIFEAEDKDVDSLKRLFKFYKLSLIRIGKTGGNNLTVSKNSKKIIDLPITRLKEAWTTGFVKALE
jgi:phosphoribosylformylglycinamidine synthase subunit PurL